jgi:hypothetical protein
MTTQSGNVLRGSCAVMVRRTEPPDSLDRFPTPAWATRSLLECVLFKRLKGGDWPTVARRPELSRWSDADGWAGFPVKLSVVEPAAGDGRMRRCSGSISTGSMRPTSLTMVRGKTSLRSSVMGVDVFEAPADGIDWVITNPPFNLALDFALRGLELAREGVALLVRSVWLEGAERYRSLFAKHPPAIVAQFVERVPMTKGRWDPDASTATAYSWFVWSKLAPAPGETRLDDRFREANHIKQPCRGDGSRCERPVAH